MPLITTGASRARGMIDIERGTVFAGAQFQVEVPPFTLRTILGAVPPMNRAKAAQAARGAAMREAQKLKNQARSQLPKVPLPGGVTLPVTAASRAAIQRAAQKLGRAEAEKLAGDTLKKMGVDVPAAEIIGALADGVSVADVKDIAYAAGKTYAEDAIASTTGFPIKLPAKLTVGEIGKSIAAVIPTDIESLIDTGLAIAGQYAASAITSALVGAGIGSVIPGLGTVIGLAVALGIGALKDAFEGEPPVWKVPCKGKVPTPQPPPNLDAFGMILWATEQRAQVSWIYANKQKSAPRGYCSGGQIDIVEGYYNVLIKKLYRFARLTPQVMGWAQLTQEMARYEKAIKGRPATMGTQPAGGSASPLAVRFAPGHYYYDYYKGTGYGSKTIVLLPQPEVAELLWLMRRRRVELVKFLGHARRVLNSLKIDPKTGIATGGGAGLAKLRWDLVTEMTQAAIQFQNQQTPQTRAWFVNLVKMYRKMADMEALLMLGRAKRAKLAAKLARERLTGPQAEQYITAHEKQLRRFQIDGCAGNAACIARVKKDYEVKGQSRAAQAARKGAGLPAKPASVQERCRKLVMLWASQNPAQAKCLNPAEANRVLQLCIRLAAKQITGVEAIRQTNAIVQAACARGRRAA